jgi:DNA-binding IclR family transcriptional regulator
MTARKAILAHLASMGEGAVVAPADLAGVVGVTPVYACRLVDRMVLAGQLRATPLGVGLGEGPPLSGPRRTAPTLRLRQDVVEILGDGPLPLPDIAQRLRIRHRHARRVLHDMAGLGLIDRHELARTRVVWRLP